MKVFSTITAAATALFATSATATGVTDGIQENEEFIGTLGVLSFNKTNNSTSKNNVQANDHCMTAANLDTIGNDFFNVRARNPDACCQVCKANGCVSYTWTDFEGGTCWFKNANSRVRIKAGARSCLLASNPYEITVARFANCDFSGNDLSSVRFRDRALCEQVCWDWAECKAMTWTDYQGGSCFFKSSAPTGCKKYDGATSMIFFKDVVN